MDKVIVAFEREKSCWQLRELLESSGTALCHVCRTAAEVRRAVRKQHITVVICGYKFPDGTAEDLFYDLQPGCSMLLVAAQGLLDLCADSRIVKLAAPVSKDGLLSAAESLLQAGYWQGKPVRPVRTSGERDMIQRAKALLMSREGMTEEQAHRFLQKKSMDSGAGLAQTAAMVLQFK